MGMFSWRTADTDETIVVGASKPVYLLQPNNREPFVESCYEGYGVFGGMDAYVWLAKMNSPLAVSTDDLEALRLIGIGLDVGKLYLDRETGIKWTIFHPWMVGVNHWDGTYEDVIPGFDKTPNELIAEGRFQPQWVRDVQGLPYPLKFSFNPKAVYDELPESPSAENQGFI